MIYAAFEEDWSKTFRFAMSWMKIAHIIYLSAPHRIMHSNWMMKNEVNLFECKWQERYLELYLGKPKYAWTSNDIEPK